MAICIVAFFNIVVTEQRFVCYTDIYCTDCTYYINIYLASVWIPTVFYIYCKRMANHVIHKESNRFVMMSFSSMIDVVDDLFNKFDLEDSSHHKPYF